MSLRQYFVKAPVEAEPVDDGCDHVEVFHKEGYVCLRCGRIRKEARYVDTPSYTKPGYNSYDHLLMEDRFGSSYERSFHYAEKVKQLFHLGRCNSNVINEVRDKCKEKYGQCKNLTRKHISDVCRVIKRCRHASDYSCLRTHLDGKDYVPVRPSSDILKQCQFYFVLFDRYFTLNRSDFGRKNMINYDFLISKLLQILDAKNYPSYQHVFKDLKMINKVAQVEAIWDKLYDIFKKDRPNDDTLRA
jgi:hypothetical protein